MENAGLRGMADAVSDDEGGVMEEEGCMERWTCGTSSRIRRKGREKKEEKGHKEVLALSGFRLRASNN